MVKIGKDLNKLQKAKKKNGSIEKVGVLSVVKLLQFHQIHNASVHQTNDSLSCCVIHIICWDQRHPALSKNPFSTLHICAFTLK